MPRWRHSHQPKGKAATINDIAQFTPGLSFSQAFGRTTDRPVIRGTAQNPDTFFQCREAANPFHDRTPQVVAEHLAEVVVAHFPDVGRSPTEAGDTDDGVGSRTATHFHGRA